MNLTTEIRENTEGPKTSPRFLRRLLSVSSMGSVVNNALQALNPQGRRGIQCDRLKRMTRALPNPDPRRSERGFTMALLLALAVVMGILLLKAEPKLEAVVQRENETELIFRGEAIANALKVYKAKSGRYPQKLEDLMKTSPHILRQPYKDPMTKDGEWEYVYQVQPGATGDTTGLPFVGVRSKSMKDSIHMYQNKTLVHDWVFSAEPNILGLPGAGGGKGAPGGDPGGKGSTGPSPTAPSKP